MKMYVSAVLKIAVNWRDQRPVEKSATALSCIIHNYANRVHAYDRKFQSIVFSLHSNESGTPCL